MSHKATFVAGALTVTAGAVGTLSLSPVYPSGHPLGTVTASWVFLPDSFFWPRTLTLQEGPSSQKAGSQLDKIVKMVNLMFGMLP